MYPHPRDRSGTTSCRCAVCLHLWGLLLVRFFSLSFPRSLALTRFPFFCFLFLSSNEPSHSLTFTAICPNSPGEGPVPYAYSAEVFPLSHREVGMAFAVATCLFWAAVLSITFPAILASLHVIGAFCLYAGFNILALVMIFFWVPETKQRTLEELDYIFAVPTRVFGRYQLREALPWFIRRWVLWERGAELRPLYQMDMPASGGAESGSESGAAERGEKGEKGPIEERERSPGTTTPGAGLGSS